MVSTCDCPAQMLAIITKLGGRTDMCVEHSKERESRHGLDSLEHIRGLRDLGEGRGLGVEQEVATRSGPIVQARPKGTWA